MRYLWKIIGGVVLLLLITGSAFLFLFGVKAPSMIASKLSEKLHTTVMIGGIHLSFGSLTVDRFEIQNPTGFETSKALSAQKIEIDVRLTHLLRDTVEIDQIVVSDIFIGLEFDSPKSTKGNWSTILKSAQPSPKTSKQTDSTKSAFIKKILLKNIEASLYYQSDHKTRKLKTIPQIELHNVSSKGGNVGEQLMDSALGEAVKQIFVEENLKDTLDNLLQTPLKDTLGPLKGIFGKTPAP